MIPKREILDIATQTNLQPHVVEKDYVIGAAFLRLRFVRLLALKVQKLFKSMLICPFGEVGEYLYGQMSQLNIV